MSDTLILFEKNIEIIDITESIIRNVHIQDFNTSSRQTGRWIKRMSEFIELLEKNKYFNEEIMIIAQILKSVLSAQEKNDNILIADILEINIIPVLYNIQDTIRNCDEIKVTYNYFSKNIKCLEKMDKKLAVKLEAKYKYIIPYLKSFEMGEEFIQYASYADESNNKSYILETTQCGHVTLKIEHNGDDYYMCGNVNPYRDSVDLFRECFNPDSEQYVIYGLGLGYIIKAMHAKVGDAVSVQVYENDINIIVLAFMVSDFTMMLMDGYKIFLDETFSGFTEILGNNEYDPVLIMDSPSIRNIQNENVKEKMEDLYIHKASIKNQLFEMNANLKSNIRECNSNLDEVEFMIKGKDVYLIAAGPSLDNNMEMLKERPDNSVMIAVGRIYGKLLSAGIIPDYVIYLDSAKRIYGQFSGLEKNNIPLLIGSTACRKIAKNSVAPKYILCQKGYKKAEEYAENMGCYLFHSGGSVATLAFDAAVTLGAKRIITLGLDLAYSNGKTHADGAFTNNITSTDGLIRVKGKNGETVYTVKGMDIYRRWFEERIKDLKEEGNETEFLNATEGGANIEGMKNIKLSDMIHEPLTD